MPVLGLGSIFPLLLLGQLPTIPAEGFSKSVQIESALATVQVRNAQKKVVGSGALLIGAGAVAYVLTAAHVVEGADSVEICVFSAQDFPRQQKIHSGRVIARAQKNQDLALVRITGYSGESEGIPIAPKMPIQGNSFKALSVGCPDVAPVSRIESIQGPVLAAKPGESPSKYWRSETPGQLGESGGPLVNVRGQIIGLRSGIQGQHAFFCHLDEIHALIRQSGLGVLLDKKMP